MAANLLPKLPKNYLRYIKPISVKQKDQKIRKLASNFWIFWAFLALCQMMLVKRNLRIIGDQEDYFLLILFSLKAMHYRDES